MIKKGFFVFLLMIFMITLSGCSAKEKEFSGSGINISLTNEFFEQEVIQAPFYLESKNHIFMGMRETKAELSLYSIDTLSEYINAVLANGGVTTEVYMKDNDDNSYMYAYYSTTVGEIEYGYMLIAMEGESHYYSMNFGCLNDKLDGYKDQYFKWAETISVD